MPKLGTALTVIVTVVLQPAAVVYVMTLVPLATPVTSPVEASTVATAMVPLLKVPPVILGVKVVVEPTQTLVVPLIVGRALTVTVVVVLQPLLLV